MKAKLTYYSLIVKQRHYANPNVTEILTWEIHFGDYDLDVVKDERNDICDNYHAVKIIITSDRQRDIEYAVDQLNSKELHDRLEKAEKAVEDEAGIYISVCDECEEPFETDISTVDQIVCGDCQKKWTAKNRTIKIPTKSIYHEPNHEQREIDTLAHVAQAYLVIWFDDHSVEVFNRNYTLVSHDPEVAKLTIEHKDEFKQDREVGYRSPATGRIGEGRWYHSDPDIIDYRLSPLTSTTER